MTRSYPGGPARHPPVAEFHLRARDALRSARHAVVRGGDRARRLLDGTTGRNAKGARFEQWTVGGANLLTIFLFACYLDVAVFSVFMLAFAALLLMRRIQREFLERTAGLDRTSDREINGVLVPLHAILCLVLCVMVAVAGWLVSFYSPPAGHVLIALALTAVPWLGQLFVRRVRDAGGEFRAVAISDGVTYGLQVFGALVLVTTAAAWATPSSALSVLALSSSVGFAVGCWRLRRHALFKPAGADAYRKTSMEVWRVGKRLSAQNMPGWGGRHVRERRTGAI